MSVSAAAQSPYPAAWPLADEVLDTMSATALPGFARNAQALSDNNTQLFLQQVGAGGRVAIDNWWSQTGAALIYTNLLTTPIAR